MLLDGKNHDNMYFAGRVFKLLCLDFKILENELKKLKRNFDDNLKNAKKGYEEENGKLCQIKKLNKGFYFINGTQGIAEGAIKSGIDIYYAYPMTPATPLLGELAKNEIKNNILVLELENEIAVINAAIGSAITGAKSMVGTSGGGFDLMTEALSMTGVAEIPLVAYLSIRPGPGTGVATYTGQGDLHMARHSGHGEFQRVVAAPGEPIEASEIISQLFYLSQKYKIPCIFLGDKHLAESGYTLDKEPKITKSEKLINLMRYNSYEKDSSGSATEDAEIIKKNIERRKKKIEQIKKEVSKFDSYKIHGNKNSKNLVISWGSTKGAILDAIKNIDCKFLQVLYIEPFSDKIKYELEKSKKIILVENNSTGQLADVVAEKTGIIIPDSNKILRYDGRPFLSDELEEEIRRKMK